MNAVHVLRRSLRVFHLVLFSQARVAVADGASVRQSQFEDRGIRVFYRQDIVGAVAVGATGRAGGA